MTFQEINRVNKTFLTNNITNKLLKIKVIILISKENNSSAKGSGRS